MLSVVRLGRGLLPSILKQRSGTIVHITPINSSRHLVELMSYSGSSAKKGV
jgi:NADP-dependent 3-hydroxy acid dehydrogenase YdfG